jgi:integrase/recombinase XerC
MNEIIKINDIKKVTKSIIEVIEDFTDLKNSNHTKRAYKNDLMRFFNFANIIILNDLGTMKYNEIIVLLQQYIENIKKIDKTEKRERVTNSRTVNRKINSLKSFFEYLVQVYNYPKNPMKQFINLKTDNFSNTVSLTRAEMVDLLEYMKGKHRNSKKDFRDYLIIIFLFNLALRCDEVASLQWSDLKLEDQTANIYQKGGSYKLLPLPHSLCLLLQEFKTLYNNACSYLFNPLKNNSGGGLEKPLNVKSIYEMVCKVAKDVVPNKRISPHSLRKTFIELALNNGDDFISICNGTGHNTVEMIKYYDTRSRLKNNSVNSLGRMI